MTEVKIEVVKQWLRNKKEFTTLEVIEALEKETNILKAEKTYLSNVNNEQAEIITKLVAQNEKMVCCGNCRRKCWDFPTFRTNECLDNNFSLWEMRK